MQRVKVLSPISMLQALGKRYEFEIHLLRRNPMTMLGLAILVVVVAGIGILVSIYNSMNDRRHEIAVMRALGARRATVMSIILRWMSTRR